MFLRVVIAVLVLSQVAFGQSCTTLKACSTTQLKEKSGGSTTCIKALQQAVGTTADGDFGPKTTAAVIAFQKSHGLTPDGVVGPKTWAAILKAKCTTSPAPSGSCKPKVSIPAWNGGTANQLACVVKTLARAQGLTVQTQWAYIMATVQHETANSYKPVKEGYYLGEPRAENYRKTLRYYPYYGRGYVQLTWQANYQKFSTLLGCNLVSTPSLALRPDISLYVMVYGMSHGSFTGAKLSTYVRAGKTDYTNARRVINGVDRASTIASYAAAWNRKYSTIC